MLPNVHYLSRQVVTHYISNNLNTITYNMAERHLPFPLQLADRLQILFEVLTVSFRRNFIEHLAAAGTVYAAMMLQKRENFIEIDTVKPHDPNTEGI